jgi:hypothetical protein
MLQSMQNHPLLISSLIEHAQRHHADGRDRVAAGRARRPRQKTPGCW